MSARTKQTCLQCETLVSAGLVSEAASEFDAKQTRNYHRYTSRSALSCVSTVIIAKRMMVSVFETQLPFLGKAWLRECRSQSQPAESSYITAGGELKCFTRTALAWAATGASTDGDHLGCASQYLGMGAASHL